MPALKKKATHIGCSGFSYKDWKGKFYPEDLAQKKWLEFYAKEFNCVELNNTFYHTPKDSTLEKWHQETPENFRFAVKGSRYVTHTKRLLDPAETVKKVYDSSGLLKDKLGCILWQLPPSMDKDLDRLEPFIKACDNNFTNVIEFRHESWFCEEVYDILREHNISLCLISAPGDLPAVQEKTTDTVYLRFHGKSEKHWYQYDYSDKELKEWAGKIKALDPRQFYAFFNNDYRANAVKNARRFREIVES